MEILKLLDNGIIYPISDSQWVSPVHVVPKKAGFTVVENKQKELAQIRLPTKVRVCIDYRKLNAATRKDHFPLPFIDQMLERLAGHEYYCFLDGYSGYNQIFIGQKTKKIPRSPAHSESLLIDACPLDCAMLPQHSNGACLVFSPIWSNVSLRFLWMISPSTEIHLISVFIT